MRRAAEMDIVKEGDVLVADMTDPDWGAGDEARQRDCYQSGGRTCPRRSLPASWAFPAVVGCGDATDTLSNGDQVTVSCAEGDTGPYFGRASWP